MKYKYEKLLKAKCSKENYRKISRIPNKKVFNFIAKYAAHCNPDSVFIRSDSKEDLDYVRQKAIENGEEIKLKTEGHTVHFDGYNDQARDKENTLYLLPSDVDLGSDIKSIELKKGLEEVHKYLKDSMVGKEMYVGFFCLGPTDSEFSILSLQITDSAYVMHSEGILVRPGYEQFIKAGEKSHFFKFVHTAGLLEDGVSKDIDMRRIYIDLEDETVYSTNTQYAGNTIGLKKLAMRLAIRKASYEGWLTEHMFIMGVHGPKDRVTYFTGSFPSACGKTSTAMLEGETIVGDDIAYLRIIDGEIRAVNVEAGIFGIIQDVNEKSLSTVWEALNEPGEVIFSNVLVSDGKPFWLGDGREVPDEGINYSGRWYKGKCDDEGYEIPHSHKNARFTVSISGLKNRDKNADSPEGVPVGGVIYGGRDSDTWVPVEEAFDWNHGILTKGAAIESETTAATLGKEGVRKFNLMANLDFLSIPLGRYINNNCDMGNNAKRAPKIFSVNYFLRNEHGEFLNDNEDKRVWIKWMELRVHGEADAVKTPTGYIPYYEDLRRLFKEVLDKIYTEEAYEKQFTVRVPQNISKIERLTKIYKHKVPDAPHILFEHLQQQENRLREAREKYGTGYITPSMLIGK